MFVAPNINVLFTPYPKTGKNLSGTKRTDKAKNIIKIATTINGNIMAFVLLTFLKPNWFAIRAISINTRQISDVGMSCK